MLPVPPAATTLRPRPGLRRAVRTTSSCGHRDPVDGHTSADAHRDQQRDASAGGPPTSLSTAAKSHSMTLCSYAGRKAGGGTPRVPPPPAITASISRRASAYEEALSPNTATVLPAGTALDWPPAARDRSRSLSTHRWLRSLKPVRFAIFDRKNPALPH